MTAHPIDTEALREHLRRLIDASAGPGNPTVSIGDLRALLDALAAAEARAIRAEAQSEARRIDIAYWTARAQMMGRKRDAGLRDLAHVQKERDNALARIKAVRELHSESRIIPGTPVSGCAECGEPNETEPCASIRVLEG